jgi:protein dithiol oxidoreductase (disulfide-forming)
MHPFIRFLRFAACAFLFLAGQAGAQIVVGKDYRTLNPPQPVGSGARIEVLEFFWYACPHCHNLQPSLSAWLGRKPEDVEFRRVPAAFHDSWLQLARTYYAVEAMGLVDRVHHDLFIALHDQRILDPKRLLRDPKPLFDWIGARGVDQKRFIDTYNSFAVNSRTQRTFELTRRYDIPGTPALVVDGKYLTAPSMTLNPDNSVNYERFFRVLDEIIALARKERRSKQP